MKRKSLLIIMLVVSVFLISGCSKTLQDKEKKPVINPETGQTLTANILCQPENKNIIKIYKENKIDISKLQKCDDFEITKGEYEGVWTTVFVKPLVWTLINLNKIFQSYGLAIIIITLLIRIILIPVTKKTAIQSENMKKAQPEIEKVEKKYKDRNDQESSMQKGQELLLVYKKYNINPMSGCLFSLIQIPLFFAFFEAMNRLPAIFEEKFIGFQLGTSPANAFSNNHFEYIIIIILVFVTTYYSFKLNGSTSMSKEQESQMKFMMKFMLAFILIMSFSISAGIALYWIVNSSFTIFQNMYIKRSKKNESIKV
ncbi:MAG: YidC/Oxa1 family membrane protein insertase [Bacilli bacterium]|nr:YidC/Oxa1 family membrane protein insertase [Bacilli bacterium]